MPTCRPRPSRAPTAPGVARERLSLSMAARLSRYLQVLTQAKKDGQGDDLLPGALGLHARQLDADPPRPVRVRQVRRARGSATTSTRSSRRSTPSCGPPASTTSPCSAPATWAGPSPRRTSSPTIAYGSWPSSTSTPHQVVDEESDTTGGPPPRRPRGPRSRQGGHRHRRPRRARPPRPRASPTRLVQVGVKIIFNYSEALLQVPPRGHRPHPRAPRSTCSTRCCSSTSLDLFLCLSTPPLCRTSSRRPRTARSGVEGVRRPRPRPRWTSCRASSACATRAAATDPVLADAHRRRARLGSPSVRSGRGEGTSPDAVSPPARRTARGSSRSRRPRTLRLGATRRDRLGRLPRAAQHRHRALPPRRRGPAVRRRRRGGPSELRVHVGVRRSPDRAVRACDRLRPVLPLLLAP